VGPGSTTLIASQRPVILKAESTNAVGSACSHLPLVLTVHTLNYKKSPGMQEYIHKAGIQELKDISLQSS